MKTGTFLAVADVVRTRHVSASTPLEPRMTGASLDGTTLLEIILWRGLPPVVCKNHDEIKRTEVTKNAYRLK